MNQAGYNLIQAQLTLWLPLASVIAQLLHECFLKLKNQPALFNKCEALHLLTWQRPNTYRTYCTHISSQFFLLQWLRSALNWCYWFIIKVSVQNVVKLLFRLQLGVWEMALFLFILRETRSYQFLISSLFSRGANIWHGCFLAMFVLQLLCLQLLTCDLFPSVVLLWPHCCSDWCNVKGNNALTDICFHWGWKGQGHGGFYWDLL